MSMGFATPEKEQSEFSDEDYKELFGEEPDKPAEPTEPAELAKPAQLPVEATPASDELAPEPPPSDELSEPTELTDWRDERIRELEAAILTLNKSQQPASTPTSTPAPAEFGGVSEEDFDTLLTDPAEFNAFMNRFRESVIEQTVHKAAQTASTALQNQLDSNRIMAEFYARHPDLVNHGSVLNQEGEFLALARPDLVGSPEFERVLVERTRAKVKQHQPGTPGVAVSPAFSTPRPTTRKPPATPAKVSEVDKLIMNAVGAQASGFGMHRR